MLPHEFSKEKQQKEVLYIGLDVHKSSWSVSIMSDHSEIKPFSQPPKPQVLYNYLQKHFPEAHYKSAYEAGFCGFWIHRELQVLGIDNLVINPADIPSTDKEKKRKSDRVDCRKIARSRKREELTGIYVPSIELEADRILVRSRQKVLNDIKRCKNRIKSLLHYLGVEIPEVYDRPYWSKGFIEWLEGLSCLPTSSLYILQTSIEELQVLTCKKKGIEKQIVALSQTTYKDECTLLRSIPGIGLLGAMTLITEIGDINRFNRNDELHSFVGLVPNVYGSGDLEFVGGVTQRHNHYLRPVVVQCAWITIKTEPELFKAYNKFCKRMKASKAIIRIAKKLLNRVSYVWKNGCEYEIASQ